MDKLPRANAHGIRRLSSPTSLFSLASSTGLHPWFSRIENKKIRNLLFFALVVFLLGFVLVGRFNGSFDRRGNTGEIKQSGTSEVKSVNVEVAIDTGEKVSTYSAQLQAGSNVLDVLKDASRKNNFSVSVKEYPNLGSLVEEISGVKNGQIEGKYWIYYVNGKSADVGASSKKVEEGDKILWKYEKSI